MAGTSSLAIAALLALESEANDAAYFDETKDTTTLFAFDNVSIPFSQNLKLKMRSPERHPANPVVTRGPDGAVDSWAVQFYGSVIRDPDSGKYRMWCVAVSKEERLDDRTPRSAPWRVAYAESDDEISWAKPNLSLVQSGGDKNNNLVKLDPAIGVLNLKVLDEPDDPDPERRFKMGAHVWFPKNDVRFGTLAPYGRADGLTWKLLADSAPIDAEFPEARSVIPPLHFEPVGRLYQWKDLTIDLGLAVSNNGVHFREPIHEWTFLRRGEDGAWDPRAWEDSPPRGGVGIVTLPRDRFADLVVDESTRGDGDYQMKQTVSSFMTKALEIEKGERQFYINADGLGVGAVLARCWRLNCWMTRLFRFRLIPAGTPQS